MSSQAAERSPNRRQGQGAACPVGLTAASLRELLCARRLWCVSLKIVLRLWEQQCSARVVQSAMKPFFLLLLLSVAPSVMLADIDPIRVPPTRPATPAAAAITAPAAPTNTPTPAAKKSAGKKKHGKKHAKKHHKAQ